MNPFTTLLIATAVASTLALADITYVDAVHGESGNTFRTGSTPDDISWLDTVSNGTATNNTNWVLRMGADFGNSENSLQSITSAASFPEITTRITGLADGTYTIWAFYWDQVTSDTQNWTLTAGLTSGSLTLYSSPGQPAISGAATAGVSNAADLTFTSPAPKVVQSTNNQNLFGVELGNVTIAGGSAVNVYIDNNRFNLSGHRVAYDGVGYELVPPPRLAITPNAVTPGTYDFSWNSLPGKVYDLLASTDLATPVTAWPVYNDGVTLHQAIPATGTTTTRTGVPSAAPHRFFAMREYDAPPLLSEGFDDVTVTKPPAAP